MNEAITINSILTILGVFVAVVAGGTAVYKIIQTITSIHDRFQKYDGYEAQIDKAHQHAQNELDNIKEEMKKEIALTKEEIALTHAESNAKMQQLMIEQYILTKSMLAVLDGLKQQGCNGAVTKAKEELEKYLVQQAHDGV